MSDEYDSGKSLLSISKNYGCSHAGICRLFKKHGKQLRTKSQYQRKYRIDDSLFSNLNEEWKSYFLGWVYSDGCLSGGAIDLATTEKDREVLDFFNLKIFNSEKPIDVSRGGPSDFRGTVYQSKPRARLRITNQQIYKDLINWGLTTKKSLTIEFPSYEEINYSAFFRGIFEGDGSIYCKDKLFLVRICTASIDFMDGMSEFLKKERIEHSITKDKNNVLMLIIRRVKDIYKFYNFIYKDAEFFLKRKHDVFLEIFKSSVKHQYEISHS